MQIYISIYLSIHVYIYIYTFILPVYVTFASRVLLRFTYMCTIFLSRLHSGLASPMMILPMLKLFGLMGTARLSQRLAIVTCLLSAYARNDKWYPFLHNNLIMANLFCANLIACIGDVDFIQ